MGSVLMSCILKVNLTLFSVILASYSSEFSLQILNFIELILWYCKYYALYIISGSGITVTFYLISSVPVDLVETAW
jgi:hypothetical protein